MLITSPATIPLTISHQGAAKWRMNICETVSIRSYSSPMNSNIKYVILPGVLMINILPPNLDAITEGC